MCLKRIIKPVITEYETNILQEQLEHVGFVKRNKK